ncbi:MAG: HD domain-containing protein [Firmicutes bacterium]|nr:HD domain-containing protein [Bacillota bacterium]
MDLEQIKELAQSTMGRRQSHPYRQPGYIFYHGQRVGNLALTLRELVFPGQIEDDDVILVGSWFHDVAKGLEPHWEYGALLAGKLLEGRCSQNQLDQIQEIIKGHTLRKEKFYPHYVQLVQDADLLDHMGTQEIWLSFLHAAGSGRDAGSVLDFYKKEYKEKIARDRLLLNYSQSVEIFEEKNRFVEDFAARLARENQGYIVRR